VLAGGVQESFEVAARCTVVTAHNNRDHYDPGVVTVTFVTTTVARCHSQWFRCR